MEVCTLIVKYLVCRICCAVVQHNTSLQTPSRSMFSSKAFKELRVSGRVTALPGLRILSGSANLLDGTENGGMQARCRCDNALVNVQPPTAAKVKGFACRSCEQDEKHMLAEDIFKPLPKIHPAPAAPPTAGTDLMHSIVCRSLPPSSPAAGTCLPQA